MDGDSHSKISQRIGRLRWQVPVLAFLLVLAHQIVEHVWLIYLPRWQHFYTQLLFYGLIGPLLAWWALTSLQRRVVEVEKAEKALRQAHNDLSEANQRLEFLILVSRRLAEADDEEALTDIILDLPQEVVPAVGCSLIRFDEQGHPRLAMHRGDLEPEAFKAWVAHLSLSTETNQACQHCSAHWAIDSESCPMLLSSQASERVKKVYCLELERGGHQYGILNIYLSDVGRPTSHEQALLEVMGNEISLSVDGIRLRARELAPLFHVHDARKLGDLHAELSDVLEHVVDALEVAGGVLFLTDFDSDGLQLIAQAGQPLAGELGLVKGLAKSAFEAQAPFVINDLNQERGNPKHLRSLLIAPLRDNHEVLGCMVLWASRTNVLVRRHIRLIATVAAQIALLVENHRLYLETGHQVALAERSRLAHEIHDGLAQTLGYLQLRMAQINKWLGKGDTDRAAKSLKEVESLIDEAYLDVREAIDGLSVYPGEEGLGQLLIQVCSDFQSLSGLPLEVAEPFEHPFPLEVQTQLLRIVQEALSNIRKHSRASRAWANWKLDDHWLTIRIADNGRGFAPEEVPPISHHGLRIMRERAELLDADLQVISQPGAGTEVVLRLPLQAVQKERSDA